MKTKEQEYRKTEHLSGTWLLLGDGNHWCIPALPLGKNGDEILEKLEVVFKLKESPIAVMDNGEEKEPLVEDYMRRNRENLRVSADFAFAVLRVNYPTLPRGYFDDDLLTLQHVNIMQAIVQGNTAIGEVIGEIPGEAETAE